MSQRPRGSGSIEKLPSGSWRATIRVGGRRIQATFAKKGQADDWLEERYAEKVAARIGGQRGSRPRAKLRELEDEFLDDARRRGLSDSTVRGYRSDIGIVLADWGELRLNEIDGPKLREILAEMAGKGWSPATQRNRLDRITGMVRMAQEAGWIAARPLPVRRPRLSLASRPSPYPQKAVKALIRAAEEREDSRYLAAVLLGARAGLRAGEVGRFRACDLDRRRRQIIVPVRSKEDQPKGRRERIVPVPESVVRAIMACGRKADEFVVNPGTWKSAGALQRWLHPIWKSAKVGPVHFHRLRHLWCSTLADRGVSPYTLMAWGGWRDLRTLLRYYHFTSGDRAVVDSLDE